MRRDLSGLVCVLAGDNDKKTKYQVNVLPLRSLRGDRPTRLDTTLRSKVASSILCSSGRNHRTGAKYDLSFGAA